MRTIIRASAVVLVLALALPAAAAAASHDLSDLAAGRVRYLEGPGIQMTFSNQTIEPQIDYLVLVGATFNTNEGRLEMQALNGNLFWVGRQTDFHFEASDPAGDGTSLFLARGAFIVKTEKPFTVITGAGSVYFPGDGVYSVSKAELGTKKTEIAVLSGPRPEVVKQATLFSRIGFVKGSDADLASWMKQRKQNWQRTVGRANVYSNVDKMPPMVAYTDAAGVLRWQRVSSVRAITRMQGLVVDNFFRWPGVAYLRAASLLTPYPNLWTDYEIFLWFLTNRFNSVRWAWNVERGWHAEWYYDPLAGFGAEFSTARSLLWDTQFDWSYARFYPVMLGLGESGCWNSTPGCGVLWTNRLTDPNWEASAVPVNVPTHRANIQKPLRSNPARPMLVRLTKDARNAERLRADPGLRNIRRARRPDIARADIAHARARSRRSAAFRTSRASESWYGANSVVSRSGPSPVTTSSPAAARRSGGSSSPAPSGRTGRLR